MCLPFHPIQLSPRHPLPESLDYYILFFPKTVVCFPSKGDFCIVVMSVRRSGRRAPHLRVFPCARVCWLLGPPGFARPFAFISLVEMVSPRERVWVPTPAFNQEM